MLDIASSITNRKSKMEKIDDYIEFFKESAKVNIMDLKRIRENYKIKSVFCGKFFHFGNPPI